MRDDAPETEGKLLLGTEALETRRRDPAPLFADDRLPVEDDPEDPLRPSPWRALRRATVAAWDYPGLTMAASFISFLAGGLLWLLLPPYGGTLPTPLLIARGAITWTLLFPVWAASVHLSRAMLRRDEPALADLWTGFRQHGGAALQLGVMNSLVGAMLAGDAAFFLMAPAPMMKLLAIPFAYLGLGWTLGQPYLLPLLLEGVNPRRALIQAPLLPLAAPGIAGVAAFVIIAVCAVSWVTWLPLALVLPVWASAAGVALIEALQRRERSRAGEAEP